MSMKKPFALFLTVCIMTSILPVPAFAEDGQNVVVISPDEAVELVPQESYTESGQVVDLIGMTEEESEATVEPIDMAAEEIEPLTDPVDEPEAVWEDEQDSDPVEYYMYYNKALQSFESAEIPVDAIRFSTIGEVDEIGTYETETCYVLDCDYIRAAASFRIMGDVSLILMDGCTMEVYDVLIDSLNVLRIYAQENGTGTLIADNGDTDEGMVDGEIHIYGGNVTGIVETAAGTGSGELPELADGTEVSEETSETDEKSVLTVSAENILPEASGAETEEVSGSAEAEKTEEAPAEDDVALINPIDGTLEEQKEAFESDEKLGNSLGFYSDYDEGAQMFVQREIPADAIRFSTLGQVDEIGAYQTQTCYVLDCDYIYRETSLYIKGDVSLILMDDCRMEVFSVRVDYPFSIRIYSQANGTGTLIADNSWHSYGHGENGCAGIGASSFGIRDSVYDYNAGEIYIYGGNITAIGGPKAAGIGGSGMLKNNASAGIITIRGGVINAVGGTGDTGGTGAGIGGGSTGNATNITISGGIINARSVARIDRQCAAAIGCGGDSYLFSGGTGGGFENITISGGIINAETSGYGAGIGGGYRTDRGARNIVITGGSITVNADAGRFGRTEECAAGIGGGYKSSGINISISGNDTQITAIGATDTAIGCSGGTANITIDNTFRCSAGRNIDNLTYRSDPVNAVSTNKAARLFIDDPYRGTVYIDENGQRQTHQGCSKLSAMLSNDELCNWNSQYNPTKWYVVEDKLTIPDTVYVSGDITLVLMDGCELNATGGRGGLRIDQDSSLTIYGQTAQSGKLNCVLDQSSTSPIYIASGGSLTINGGKITSQTSSGYAFEAQYGKLIINRGEITASASGPVVFSRYRSRITVGNDLVCYAGSNMDNLAYYSSDSVDALCTYSAVTLRPSGSFEQIDYSDADGIDRTHPGYCTLTAGLSSEQLCGWNPQNNPTRWYVVKDKLTIPNDVDVTGDITLVLADDCELNLPRGLRIYENSSLTIYGQTAQSGKLILDKWFSIYEGSATINGGIFTSQATQDSEGLTFNCYQSELVINRGDITAINSLASLFDLYQGKLTINGGKINASHKSDMTTYFPVINNQGANITISSDLVCYAGSDMNNLTERSDPVDALCTNEAAMLLPPGSDEIVSYIDESGTNRIHPGFYVLSNELPYDPDAIDWNPQNNPTKWYVVKEQFDIPTITVDGDITLVLADDCELNAQGGLRINENSSLTIYGQTAQSGKLSSVGEYNAFDIGNGSLTINGGIIDVQIIDEFRHAFDFFSGEMIINRGKITASTLNEPVIFLSDGKLTINGGDISLSSSNSNAVYASRNTDNITVSRSLQCYAGSNMDDLTYHSDPENALCTNRAVQLRSSDADSDYDSHTHSFRYTASGNQITAVCSASDCPCPENRITLTLNAPTNLSYDGRAKEVRFTDGEAEAWEAATGNDVPRVSYAADRGSRLIGGKAVNAGSYTANITVNGNKASLEFSVTKAEYVGVTKTVSAELKAAKGSKVTITLPEIPRGASYGKPVKVGKNDPYTLSGISRNKISVMYTGTPNSMKPLTFTVPVTGDNNHNGYTVTVTVNVIRPEVNLAVNTSKSSRRALLGIRVPIYTASVTADSDDVQIARVEYSLTGLLYTVGNKVESLLPISHFYIRLTDSNGARYVYEYKNGKIIER